MRVAVLAAATVVASLVHGIAPAVAAVGCAGEVATIIGTAGDDVIIGTAERDVIHALAGRDVVRGLAGNDIICGGGGRDRIYGGPGDDVIHGGASVDRIRGGPGHDVVRGGPRNDNLLGGRHSDVIRGGPGDDVARGGSGRDVCIAADGVSCGGPGPVGSNLLGPGESLLPGQELTSADGRTRLAVDRSGNATIWWGDVDVWDTDTAGSPNARLTMTAQGSLDVIWRGAVIWSSATAGRSVRATLGNDANLILHSRQLGTVWDRRSHPGVIDWHLPYPVGESWEAGAPHGENLSALDFGPHVGSGEVVAVASGWAGWFECQSGGRYLKVDHGAGYMSTYYHLVDIRTELIGQWVEAGTVLGKAGNGVPCGGRSTFAHVHLTLWRDGQRMSADGLMLRGYSVHAGSEPYHGHWKDSATGETILVNPGGAVCCLVNRG